MTTQTDTTLDRVLAIMGKIDMPHGEPPAPDQQLFYVAKMESSDQARERGNYGFDSLDRVEIVMTVEDEFGFEIPDCDVIDNPSWNTAEGIAAYVDSRLEQARS
jgi:acyl carrier protein